MHQAVMGTFRHPKRWVVDHIDGNGLNNQRANLRRCTHGQNMLNRKKRKAGSSQYFGVSRSGNQWQARIEVNGVTYKRRCASELEAAHARDAMARKFAVRNAELPRVTLKNPVNKTS